MGKDLKGKELGEGLAQRKDGRYRARYVSVRGKRFEKTFKTKAEATKWLRDSKYNDEHGKHYIASDMTLDDFFEYYLEAYKENSVEPTTIVNYRAHYKFGIRNTLGDMLLRQIKAGDIQFAINTMAINNLSHQSILNVKALLSDMFKRAVSEGYIETTPVINISIPKNKKAPKKKALSDDEVRELISNIADRSNEQYVDVVRLVLNTGLRASELCGLTWDVIDFDKREMVINKQIVRIKGEYLEKSPKTKTSNRTIPLTDEAIEILQRRLECNKKKNVVDINTSKLVFMSMDGKHPLGVSNLDNILKNAQRKHGAERVSMHQLRHTFATRCIENGMQPKTLQTILGHSNIATTLNLYVHISNEHMQDEMKNIANQIRTTA